MLVQEKKNGREFQRNMNWIEVFGVLLHSLRRNNLNNKCLKTTCFEKQALGTLRTWEGTVTMNLREICGQKWTEVARMFGFGISGVEPPVPSRSKQS